MPAARMPGAFSDDIPELNRQMGCMAGIFQIFDRQRLITGRRGERQAQKRLSPPPASGNTVSKSNSNVPVQSPSTPKIVLEKTFSKSTTENSSLSNESSRASSSSSSCSSFSSLDGNKSVQQELPYTNEELFVRRSLKSSPSLKGTDMNTKPEHPNVGFRDIVKDSINRDTGALTVKTSVQEARRNGQYKDSPRPLLLSKSVDGSIVIGIDRSTNVLANVTESSRRFKEQSRFSCDDRRLLRPAETQESKRASTRLKELPRLSLDSRKESLSPSSRLKNSSYKRTDDSLLDTFKPQDSPSHKRANSVIAKLMGLEEATAATGMLIAGDYEPSRSPRPVQVAQYEQPSRSPRSTCQDSCVSQLKNESSVLKTKPYPRVVTEAAPWRQQDRGATNFKAPQCREAEVRPRTASIYADIERLGGLDFLECSKDFRALRILHGRDAKRQNDNHVGSLAVQPIQDDSNTNSRNFHPPIVVIKPARTTGKPGVLVSSVTSVSGLRSLKKLQPLTTRNETSTNEKNNSRMAKAQSKSEESIYCTSSPRPTGSSSPRMAQKKSESERRSRPPVSPRSPSKKSNEAASPRGRTRSKPSQVKSPRDNEVLQSTGRRISLVKEVDVSIMDCQKPQAVSSSFGRPSNTAATSSQKGLSIVASDSLENIPSPVSVLDTSYYHRRISDSFKGASLMGCLKDIPTLKGDNYGEWKRKLDLAFVLGEVDWVVTTPCPTEPADPVRGAQETDAAWQTRQREHAPIKEKYQLEHRQWTLANKKCLAVVKNTIEPSILGSIPEEETVTEYLQKIHNQFTGSSKTYATQLMKQLVNQKYTGGGIREHILRTSNLVSKLKPMNVNIDNELLIQFIFISLPKQFDNFIVNYNMNPGKWTFEQLIANCVQEEERIKESNGGYLNFVKDNKGKGKKSHSSNGQGKKHDPKHGQFVVEKDQCLHCKKTGHYKKDCPEYQKLKKKGFQNDESNAKKRRFDQSS